MELTPKDYARLWPETVPALDVALDNGRAPSPRSRVPAHVQQNRPRLDGRRRR